MPLDVVRTEFVGSTVVTTTVSRDVADIARRVREGDPTIGWTGCPTMELRLGVECDPRGRPIPGGRTFFEVWDEDAKGEPYVALIWPRCDASLLRRLVEIDNRVNPLADRIAKANVARERDEAAKRKELVADVADRLHFALMKDLGHLTGGTRRLHSMSTGGAR